MGDNSEAERIGVARGASVAGEPWATILGFARRAQVPDMLGVVEQEWVRHSPEKKPPPV